MQAKYILAAGWFTLSTAAAPAMAHAGADPDDGIRPWIGMNSDSARACAQVLDQAGYAIEVTRIDRIGRIGAAGVDNDYASLHVDARDDAANLALTLHGGWGDADTGRRFRCVLWPNTRMLLSVDADPWARQAVWPTAIAESYGRLSVTAATQGDWVGERQPIKAHPVAKSPASAVPEPAMPTMVVGGLGILAFARRRGWR